MRQLVAGAVVVAVVLAAACGTPDAATPGAPPPATADPTASADDDTTLAVVLAASTVVATTASWRVTAPAGDDGSLAEDVAGVMCAADTRWLSGGVERQDDEPLRQTQRVWGLAVPGVPREAAAELDQKVEQRAAVTRSGFETGQVLELVGDGSSVTHLVAEEDATRLTYTGEAVDVAGVEQLARSLATVTAADVGSVVVRPAATGRGC